MTDTVRIMPKQPIEAVPSDEIGIATYRSWGREVVHHDGDETLMKANLWHEVSDPIVWDGTDESFRAIREALAHGQGVLEVWLGDDEYEPHIEITSRSTLNRVGLVVHGAGVRIEGDSFVILPSEVTA